MTDPMAPTGPDRPIAPDGPIEPDRPTAKPTEPSEQRERRPMIERIGLALVALVLASLFGVVSAASWVGGELFLAAMAGIGCLMTIWVGAVTLVRG
jgi:hypothetical protein